MKKIILFSFSVLAFLNLYSQTTYVFFGSYNWDKTKDGIYVYELDTTSGDLSNVISLKDILNPSFLTISPNGKFIYACTDSKTQNAGSVSSFGFNPNTKNLTFINSQKSGGENPVSVSVHQNGRWLVNANYTEGSVSVYPIAQDGSIKKIAQNFEFSEGSINLKRQTRSHVHSAVFSPDSEYVFLPDLGADKIRRYKFENDDSEPLKMTGKPHINTTLGSGPRYFTFHPGGKFAYCVEELSGSINVYLV